jgi:peptidoglycan hydrolase CwlO-like protein
VKYGTELATEIRDLRKRKEKFGFERQKLQRKKEIEDISDHQFDLEKEIIDSKINETSAKIDELKARLNELKKVNK